MSIVFFLDNRVISAKGPLPSMRQGNPGMGGAEYSCLHVVECLHDYGAKVLLCYTATQSFAGLDQSILKKVTGIGESIRFAESIDAKCLVFRPNFFDASDWPLVRGSRVPLIAWLHNLGFYQQDLYEATSSIVSCVFLSGAQADYFRHSRIFRKGVVIPYPVAVPHSSAKSRTLEIAKRASDLAYVGALTPFKGFDKLASQWRRIASNCPTAKLRVFGGADLYGEINSGRQLTPYEDYCRSLILDSGYSDRVVFE